jgi:hypothetical protein
VEQPAFTVGVVRNPKVNIELRVVAELNAVPVLRRAGRELPALITTFASGSVACSSAKP